MYAFLKHQILPFFPSKIYFDHRKIEKKNRLFAIQTYKCEYEHIGDTAEVHVEILRVCLWEHKLSEEGWTTWKTATDWCLE